MSSSASRGGGERMVHQDFIARIRFSNALPPPPNPPKLLDIPNTGLASGQYTTPGFASRLAREQPVNIEADAELGMPLDLVGMPGVFDGDESSIQPSAHTPPVHPHDRPLLRPLSTLGKPKVTDTAVSFLRRTEYIATKRTPAETSPFLRPSQAKKAGGPGQQRRAPKRPSPEIDIDAGTPAHVKRKIAETFDHTARDLADPSARVKHPRNMRAQLVGSFPLFPDLDAFPDSGAYVTVKFYTAPMAGVPGSNPSSYDNRLLASIFRPIDKTPEEERILKQLEEAHQRDPGNNPKPSQQMEYEFYLPASGAVASGFRRKFDVDEPDRDDDELYTTPGGGEDGKGCFQFTRVRRYETSDEVELDHMTKYDSEVLVSLDAGGDGGGPAALYYPVMQRSTIRPRRAKNILRTRGHSIAQEDDQVVEQLDVTVEDPTEEMREYMAQFKERPRPFEVEEEEEAVATADDADAEGEEAPPQQRQRHSSVESDGDDAGDANGRGSPRDAELDEQDAEGDDDE